MNLSRGLDRFLAGCLGIGILAVTWFLFAHQERFFPLGLAQQGSLSRLDTKHTFHPIDALLLGGQKTFIELDRKRTTTLDDAAAAYRARRGRHPPPHFDRWWEWAREHNCIMIEDMFDQIYEDLEPFWAVDPRKLREMITTWPVLFTIRNGTVQRKMVTRAGFGDWTGRWLNMLGEIPRDALPDVDLAINNDDEPHLFVPWEEINELMHIAAASKNIEPPSLESPIANKFETFPQLPNVTAVASFPDAPLGPDVWELVRNACPPNSPARFAIQDKDFTVPTSLAPSKLNHMPHGYVYNFTASQYICNIPHLRNTHGYFIGSKNGSFLHYLGDQEPWPQDKVNTRILFPLFSTAKIRGVNNDILIPAAMYWGAASFGGQFHYDDADAVPWAEKKDVVMWRGASSGGVSTEDSWTRYHRYRFVSMLNATQIRAEEPFQAHNLALPPHVPAGTPPQLHNFALPAPAAYPLSALNSTGGLAPWVASFADVAFTYFKCFPGILEFYTKGKSCTYTDAFYRVADTLPLMALFRSKFLPDVDGASFSGRWRAYLLSGSLPIKATVWSEWHDARIVPWQHFVPMDNSFVDLYGLLEYFLGYKPSGRPTRRGKMDGEIRQGHDAQAKRIAEAGRDWAHQVLREEDMVLYVWRLVAEYGRITNEGRMRMGWVGDLEGDLG